MRSAPEYANDFFFFFLFPPFVTAYIGDEDNVEVRIIAGATVAVVVVLVVVIIMTVLFLRRYVVSAVALAVHTGTRRGILTVLVYDLTRLFSVFPFSAEAMTNAIKNNLAIATR